MIGGNGVFTGRPPAKVQEVPMQVQPPLPTTDNTMTLGELLVPTVATTPDGRINALPLAAWIVKVPIVLCAMLLGPVSVTERSAADALAIERAPMPNAATTAQQRVYFEVRFIDAPFGILTGATVSSQSVEHEVTLL